jgi:hypothetical protein
MARGGRVARDRGPAGVFDGLRKTYVARRVVSNFMGLLPVFDVGVVVVNA